MYPTATVPERIADGFMHFIGVSGALIGTIYLLSIGTSPGATAVYGITLAQPVPDPADRRRWADLPPWHARLSGQGDAIFHRTMARHCSHRLWLFSGCYRN